VLQFPDNERLALYTRLLHLRRERLFWRLKGTLSESADVIGPSAVRATWRLEDDSRLIIGCNLGDEAVTTELPRTQPIWGKKPNGNLPPATTLVWIE
jgi:hypothetical protein